MNRPGTRWSGVFLVAVFAVVGFGFTMSGRGATAASDRHAVPWTDYPRSLQEQIDALGSSHACSDLQDLFDMVADDLAATATRADDRAAVMQYIWDAMQNGGCFDPARCGARATARPSYLPRPPVRFRSMSCDS